MGLALGMACTILILLWVQDKLNYDRFHEKAEDIYKVYLKLDQYGIYFINRGTFAPVGKDLSQLFPEVVDYARFRRIHEFVCKYVPSDHQNNDKIFIETKGAAVDPSFLEIFTFPLLKGESGIVFKNPNSIILTENMAEKYFDDEDPINKIITINNKYDFVVTGILKNIPTHSHLRYDFLIPIEFLLKEGWMKNEYNETANETYLLLQKKASSKVLNRKIKDIYDKSIPVKDIKFQHNIEPLLDVYLYGEIFPPRIFLVYTVSLIALFILIIACINFINLNLARSMKRAKEISVRKVIGAGRKQIIKQFLSESFLMSFLALIFAISIAQLLLPLFNQSFNSRLTIHYTDYQFILGILGILILTGTLAGSYPAFYLSLFNPVNVLKGSVQLIKKRTTSGKRTFLRKSLVVIQFSLSIILIITIINSSRMKRDMYQLGFDQDNIIHMQVRGELWQKFSALKNELLRNPNITHVTTSSELPLSIWREQAHWGNQLDEKNPKACIADVGYDYINTFDLKMVQGRFYDEDFIGDRKNSIVVNETAIKALGLDSPIGKRLYVDDKEYSIIGVIQDYHFIPKVFKMRPLILCLRPESNNFIFIKLKINGMNKPIDNTSRTLHYIESVCKRLNPDYPFEYAFLSEFMFEEVKIFMAAEKLVIGFTIFGIFISALGLFGLSTYLIEQRTKEIGIRKVLGASVSKIFAILSKEYFKLIVIANLIAWPVACVMELVFTRFLFYNRIVPIWIYPVVGSFTLFVALLAVSFQSFRAAIANPVEALRYE